MKARAFREWSLGGKLAATLFTMVWGVALLISLAAISHERKALDAELRTRGVSLAQSLARLSVDLVLQDDLWGLYRVVRDIVQGEGAAPEQVVVYATVLSPGGERLAHSDPARFPISERLEPTSINDRALNADGILVQAATETDGRTIYDFTVPVILDRRKVAVARLGMTTQYLESTLSRIKREVFLISSALAALGMALGLAVSRRITRPLARLSASVQAISRGQLDERILVETTEKDEVGLLGDSFNQMATNLRESIAEIRATKQYLENLLEHANDFIYTLDLAGSFTYVNGKFVELGYRKEDLLGRPFVVLLGGAVDPATGEREGAVEVEVRDRREIPRVWVVTTSPLLDTRGQRIGVLGIAKDITERKEMERRLIRSEKLASIGELAGAVAHEIRNPLGSIFTAVNLLGKDRHGRIEPERAELLRIIQEESRRLNRILTDFVHFAHPRPPLFQPHDLNGLVEEVVEALRFDDKAKGKVFRKTLDLTARKALVDADQVKQVFWNVSLNALQAMGDGDGELAVSTVGDDGHVHISIADTGPGMSRNQLGRIFEPFHTTRREGMGLGLAIAHRIVETHRGQIRIASQEGRGTTVTIILPLNQPPSESTPVKRVFASTGDSAGPGTSLPSPLVATWAP